MLILAGAIAWGVWTATDWYGAFFDETHVWWIIGASLALVLGLGAFHGSVSGKSNAKLIKAAQQKSPPVDGKRNAFIGTVHAEGEPLLAPITKTPAVLYEYTIARGSSDSSGHEAAHYTGTHMRSPVVRTSHGSVRVFSNPTLRGFPEEMTFDAGEIEAFVDATTFERKSIRELASTAFDDLFDEDGIIGWDAQLRERPGGFSGFALKTELVREGAEVCVIGTWNQQAGTVGAGEMVEMLNAESKGALAVAGGGGAGCGCLTGIILLIASVSILALPLLPAEWLLKVPIASELVLDKRAETVERHLAEADYDRARRLSGLGLAGRSIEPLPRLLETEPDLVEVLIANGADPSSVGPNGDTILMHLWNARQADRYLRYGVNRSISNNSGWSAAAVAAADERYGLLTRLAVPKGNGSELAVAISEGDATRIENLLAGGMSPDELILLEEREVSPLFYAAALGQEEAVDVLLEAGASPDAGEAPALLGAVEAGSPEMVRRLVEAGANIEFDLNERTDPLVVAIYLHDLETVRTLVELGAGGDRLVYYAPLASDAGTPEIEELLNEAAGAGDSSLELDE